MARKPEISLRALAAALLAAGVAASAAIGQGASVPNEDPGTAIDEALQPATAVATPGEHPTDTDYTPVYKDGSSVWSQVAGAHFGETSEGYATRMQSTGQVGPLPFYSFFRAVAMRDASEGLAGGFVERSCEGRPVQVPVIYRYTHTNSATDGWHESLIGNCEHPGFVGAVAWIPSTGQALAVGGDGTYPDREVPPGPACASPTPEVVADIANAVAAARARCDAERIARDPAGKARAWLFDAGSWCELGPDSVCGELSEGMRGMTALAFDTRTTSDLGFAGSLGQLLRWEHGRFEQTLYDKDIDAGKPLTEQRVRGHARFRYRVRQIRFLPAGPEPVAVAVTAGCCGLPGESRPSVLVYSRGTPAQVAPDYAWRVKSPDRDYRDATASGGTEPTGEVQHAGLRPDLPDSLYSVTGFASPVDPNKIGVTMVATAGGPPSDAEPGSIVTTRTCDGAIVDAQQFPLDPAVELAHKSPGSARLLAGDGDSAKNDLNAEPTASVAHDAAGQETLNAPWTGRPHTATLCGMEPDSGGDGVPDWVMGELGSTRLEGLGARGLLLATALNPRLRPDTVRFPAVPTDGSDAGPLLQPPEQSPDAVRAYARSQWMLLSSYSVRAVSVLDADGTGVAVGDHGAILELNQSATQQERSPDPPLLGEPTTSELPETHPWSDLGPPVPSSGGGAVPPLAEQPVEALDEPRMVGGGSPDAHRDPRDPIEDVSQIVMSRDGSEGWAVGSTDVQLSMALYHFDGERWRRCDPAGVPGEIEPDPQCVDLAKLINSRGSRAPIQALARVPLEHDDDPTNDDEFELVAEAVPVGGGRPLLLRYRNQRWSPDPVAPTGLHAITVASYKALLAFATPRDGWLVMHNATDDTSDQGASRRTVVFHYDGETWVDCIDEPARCGDDPANRRLPAAIDNALTVRGITVVEQRTYLYGSRDAGPPSIANRHYPLILYRDPGGRWTDEDGTGHDPAFHDPGSAPEGVVHGLAVRRVGDAYEGWAIGLFGRSEVYPGGQSIGALPPSSVVMRLDGSSGWRPYDDDGTLRDAFFGDRLPNPNQGSGMLRWNRTATFGNRIVSIPADEQGRFSAFVASLGAGRTLGFDERTQQWRPLPAARPFDFGGANSTGGISGGVQALAPDHRGGVWLAVRNISPENWIRTREAATYFFHYSAAPHRPVFAEAASPTAADGSRITAMAGALNGSLWLATDSAALYHYERPTGWDRVNVKGWDPGRLVTASSPAHALAVAPSGVGVVVGKSGRIADLSPGGAVLDRAAGHPCTASPPPCGTSHDLVSVAVAPDGSAMAGGVRRVLMWRGTDRVFRVIAPPNTNRSDVITGVSLPDGDHAWVATSLGRVYAGVRAGEHWQWSEQPENLSSEDRPRVLGADANGERIALRAIAIAADGRGYAAGDRGLLLERRPGSTPVWRRVNLGMSDDLLAVTLGASGEAALIGGRSGLILTLTDAGWRVARPADYVARSGGNYASETTGPVAGLALMPGVKGGQTEAWAALKGRDEVAYDQLSGTYDADAAEGGVDALLHYTSDPDEPLLDPRGRVQPLPDAPEPRDGELAFAAFGETTCKPAERLQCHAYLGTTGDDEVITRAVIDAVTDRASRSGGPIAALFTGDAVDQATAPGADVLEQSQGTGNANWFGPLKLRAWRDWVADPLLRSGIPVFGAIGGRDLSSATNVCPYSSTPPPAATCQHEGNDAGVGDNLSWRAAMREMPKPWSGAGPDVASQDLRFVPVPGQAPDQQDTAVSPDATRTSLRVPIGGARTHYAMDVLRGDHPVARVVVVDTSQRSLQAGDPLQQPNDSGGQLAWLRTVLCETDSGEVGCTRRPQLPVVLISSTPTYSYGPGTVADTQILDGTQLETLMLSYRVSAVISGHLGWNGLYYATAPGLHAPCPGGGYPRRVPDGPSADCGVTQDLPQAPAQVSRALRGLQAPSAPAAAGVNPDAPVPFVVTSSAGGRLADRTGTAADGYWRGYSLIRISRDGDPAKTIVEQRPVFDQLLLQTPRHRILPGQTVTLRGLGREPVGVDSNARENDFPMPQVVRWDLIDSPAITHRYDLIAADPERPWLPKVDPANNEPHHYVPLSRDVAFLPDDQLGRIVSGRGNHSRVYALAVLSVGDKAASVPLVFEPRSSFRPARLLVPRPPPIPPVRVLGFSAQSLQTPTSAPPPATPPPIATTLQPPAPPAVPGLPGGAPSGVNPPLPQPPPPPPASQPTGGLDLSVAPTGVSVPPTTGVTAQPTPPVNPSPPSGARREAKQRQAATAKSEEGGSERASDAAGDLARAPEPPHGAAMTRRDPVRPAASGFTSVAHADPQPSAWVTGLVWGGGTSLLALSLALGFCATRPTPRRRPPTVPAPSVSCVRSDRRNVP